MGTGNDFDHAHTLCLLTVGMCYDDLFTDSERGFHAMLSFMNY